MDAPPIRVPDHKATYLATLYGKAQDAAAAEPILGDRFAAAAVARLDVDFAALNLPQGSAISLPIRARHFDDWTRAFLDQHPAATVLHLGCGLDARVYRIDPSPQVRWYDVDLPDVIALRRQLYPERPGYHQVEASVAARAWLDAVPNDAPVLVVAEGLLMYLHEPAGLALLKRITERFPQGEVVFDGYSAPMVRLISRLATVRGAKVELHWGVDDPHELEQQVPRLRLVESVPFLTMPELLVRLARGWPTWALYRILGQLPFYRNLVRHLRYAF